MTANDVRMDHGAWHPSFSQRVAVVLPLPIGLLTPSVVLFLVEVIVGQVSVVAAVKDVIYKQFASGHNLFLIAVVGLIPFAVLASVISAFVRKHTVRTSFALCTGGLVGILALTVLGHVSVWYPAYGPGRMSSTGAIAFCFIPFGCIATMGIGLLLGWIVSRIPWFRRSSPGYCRRCAWYIRGDTPIVCPNCQTLNVLCRRCAYDLTGNTLGACPECGTPCARYEFPPYAQPVDNA